MEEEERPLFYRLVKWLFWPIGRFYFRIRTEGGIARRGPLMLVSNHASLLDPPVLGSACPRPVRFLVTRRLYDRRAQQWFYRWMGAIPVRDSGRPDHGAIRRALRVLHEGEILGIFPEGIGLDPAGRLRSPRSGVALIASMARVPVVPVAIHGTHRSLSKGKFWPRPGRVSVVFGDPFLIEARAGDDRRRARQELTDEIMRRISSLLEGGVPGGR
jgi:1-acyl-sn-glycerol-3-phosphate acyltransferase